jgi:phosphoglycolate phosphatase
LDGTLVDSAPDLTHCVDRALESLGYSPVGERLVRSWVGDGIESLLARALEHAAAAPAECTVLDRAMKAFDACYERNLFTRSTVYPGVPETLDALRARGFTICCVTNKRTAFATSLLRQAGLIHRFEFVLGGDSLPRKKPSSAQLLEAVRRTCAAHDTAVLVGDSEHDYGAAQGAGHGFVWAAYGYRSSIPASGALTRIDEFAELTHVLDTSTTTPA